MDRGSALEIAEQLMAELQPACARIEIAGSLRRRKPEVNDLELVAIPLIEAYGGKDLFGGPLEGEPVDLLAERVASIVEARDPWQFDWVTARNGPRYKRLRHKSGVCCDLFITDPRRWGYQLAVRTGPAEFSKELVTIALRRSWHFTDSLLHQHPRIDGKVCPKGKTCPLIVPAPEELDVFEALGLAMPRPEDRTASLLWRLEKDRSVRSLPNSPGQNATSAQSASVAGPGGSLRVGRGGEHAAPGE